MALSKTTTDHEEIRRWAESRDAKPAEVASTHNDNEPGILRFQFPRSRNRNDANLREIGWDEFFQKFDESNLSLLYQEKTSTGKKSNFNKLVHPENARGSQASHSRSSNKTESSSRKRQAA